MPLTKISFLIDSSIHGIDPWGFHLSNLILHILNCLLVLYLFWLLSNNLLFSIVTSIIFAIHPQHIEAFVWIAERKEVLSSFFGLLSLIFYVTYASKLPTNESYSHVYLMSLLFFIISLLAKPSWIMMPGMLLLIDWWPLKRFRNESIRTVIIEKIPFIIIAFFLSTIILYSVYSVNLSDMGVSNSAESLPFI